MTWISLVIWCDVNMVCWVRFWVSCLSFWRGSPSLSCLRLSWDFNLFHLLVCNGFCHSNAKDDRVMQDSWDSTAARKQVSDARTAAASAALIGQEARDIFAGISSMLQSLGHLRFVGPDWPTDSDSDSRLWWDLYVGWWKGPASTTFNHEYNLSWSNQIVGPDMRFHPGTHRLLVCHVPRRLTLRSKMNQADFMTLKVLVQINASICYQISMVPIWFQCRRGKHRKTLEISDPFETDSSTTWPPPPVKLIAPFVRFAKLKGRLSVATLAHTKARHLRVQLFPLQEFLQKNKKPTAGDLNMWVSHGFTLQRYVKPMHAANDWEN